MAINQNHLFEDLNGIKCAIVEKNATKERVDFLKNLLEYNRFTVIIAASPPPKIVSPAVVKATPVNIAGEEVNDNKVEIPATTTPPPKAFTIGVTDVTFNPVNAIFGRLLTTPAGQVITLAYWQQKDRESREDVPYFNT